MNKLFGAGAVFALILAAGAAVAQGAPPGGPPGAGPVGPSGAGMIRYNSDPQDAADAATVLAWANDWETGKRLEAFEQYADHTRFVDHSGGQTYAVMIAQLSSGGGPTGPGGPGGPPPRTGPARPNGAKIDDPTCKGGGGAVVICGAEGLKGTKRVARAQKGMVTLYWEGGVEILRVQNGKITDHWDASPPAAVFINGPNSGPMPPRAPQ